MVTTAYKFQTMDKFCSHRSTW